MSDVDNVLLHASVDEDRDRVIGPLLAATPRRAAFRVLSGLGAGPNYAEGWGGDKYPEVQLLAGAFNKLDRPSLFGWLEGLPFRHLEAVQLLIRAQEAPLFAIFEFRDGRMTPVNDEARR